MDLNKIMMVPLTLGERIMLSRYLSSTNEFDWNNYLKYSEGLCNDSLSDIIKKKNKFLAANALREMKIKQNIINKLDNWEIPEEEKE